MAACTFNIRGQELTVDQIIDQHINSPDTFDDFIPEASSSDNFITGIPLRHQLQLAEHLIQRVLTEENFFSDYEVGSKDKLTVKRIKELFDKNREQIFNGNEKNDILGLKDHALEIDSESKRSRTIAAYAQSFMDNWPKIESLAIRVLINKGFFTDTSGDIDSLLDSLNENEFRNFDEDFSFTREVKDSISQRLRYFFSQIQDTVERTEEIDGETITTHVDRVSIFGYPIYKDMNDVYSEIRNILTGTRPDWNLMQAKLEEASLDKPWLTEVIESLNDPMMEVLRKEFVSNMTSHPVKMIFVKVVWDGEKYTPKIVESNRNTVTNILLENWESSVLAKDELFYEENGDFYIRAIYKDENDRNVSDYVSKLAARYSKIDKPTKEDFRKFFDDLGIKLSKGTLNYIAKNGFWIGSSNVSINSFFKTNLGSIKIIRSLQEMVTNNKPYSLNSLFNSAYGGNIMRAVAQIESKYTKDVPVSSFRTGDKSAASHALNRYAKNRERDLKEDKETRDRLRKSFFSANNYLIKARPEDGLPDGLLSDPVLAEEFSLVYPDISNVLSDEQNKKKSSELKDLGPEDHLKLAVTLFANNGVTLKDTRGKTYRSARHFGLTLSDKKLKYIFQLPTEIINNYQLVDDTGNLEDAVIDYMFDILFMPDYMRIKHEESISERNIDGYDEGRKKFFILPQLNIENEEARQALYYLDGDRYVLKSGLDLENEENEARDYVKSIIKQVLAKDIGGLRDSMRQYNTPIPNAYIENIALKLSLGNNATQEQIFNSFTADMALSNIIANVTYTQLISGDPAIAWKKNIVESFDNYTKRLAKDAAPGQEEDNTDKRVYNVLFAHDDETPSEYLSYFQKFSDGYEEMNRTDAQAFMSASEWAKLLYNTGKIDKTTKDEIEKAYLSENYEVPYEILKKIPNVFKPVIVTDHYEQDGLERKVYIKFAVYPLLPQLTKGFKAIDDVRKLMKEKNIDLTVFKSAAKLGAPKNKIRLFQDKLEYDESQTLQLNRYGYKIQQDIPSKTENLVTRATQFSKLIFNNFRHIDEISQYEAQHDEYYKKLFEIKEAELRKEIIDPETGELNFLVINELIKKELIQRKYDDGTLRYFALDDKDFAYPFYANPQKRRIEPIINALVDSRIRKLKFPGKSYVLVSNSGFKTRALTLEDYKKEGGKVIFTDTYEFGKDLKPQMFVDGEVKRAQVIVPWNFKDENGKLLNIKNYMTDGKIDFNKIPKELLHLQGFRIPTQGHNSMSAIEIVGFLPPGISDIVIAPAEYVVQMGSDFDVDKLYSYMKFYNVDADNKLSILTDENATSDSTDDQIKVLINKIIDIQDKVLSYPSEEVQQAIGKKLDYGLFDDKEFMNSLSDRLGSEKDFFYFGFSTQLNNYIGSAAAKTAVGAYSLTSTFNSLLQSSKQFYVTNWTDNTFEQFAQIMEDMEFSEKMTFSDFADSMITFGNLKGNFNLSDQTVAGSNRKKSDVISAFQSAAVDDANKRILGRLNINNNTLNVPPAVAQLGFDEKVFSVLLLTDFVRKDSSFMDFKAEGFMSYFNSELSSIVDKRLKEANPDIESNKDLYKSEFEKEKEQAFKQFISLLNSPISDFEDTINNPIAPNYDILNLIAVTKLYHFGKFGRVLADYQRIVNIDSSGLKKNFFEAIIFDLRFSNLFETNDPILNVLGEFSDTYQEGYYDVTGLMGLMGERKYYKPKKIGAILYFNESRFITDNVYGDVRLSLYKSKAFKRLLDEAINVFNDSPLQRSPTMSESIAFYESKYFRAFESSLLKYILSTNESLFNKDLSGHRKRLFSNTGLASVVEKLSEKTKTDYPFLKSLEVSISEGNSLGAKSVIYRASKIRDDFDGAAMRDFENLYANNDFIEEIGMTTKELALDLIRYNLIEDPLQSATNFSRYIPESILRNIGITETLKGINFQDEDFFGLNGVHMSSFTKQFIQNNPGMLDEKLSNIAGKSQETMIPLVDKSRKETGVKLLPVYPSGDFKGIYKVSYLTKDGPMTALYQSDGINFSKIPYLYNEYNANVSHIHDSSIIKQNIPEFSYYRDETKPKTKTNFYRDKLFKSIDNNNLEELLENIARNSNNTEYVEIAAMFLNHPLLKDVEIKFGNRFIGSTSYLDTFNLITLNKDSFKTNPVTFQEEIVLHEVTHAFTKKALTVPEEQLNSEQKSALNKIKLAHKLYKDSFNSAQFEDLKEKIRKYKNKEIESLTLTEEEFLMYGGINLEEFVSAAFSNRKVQDRMNSIIIGKSQTTLLQKFKQLILDLLKAFGVDSFTEDNPFSEAVKREIVNLIQSETDIIVPPTFNSTKNVTELTPDNPIFKLC